MKRRYLLKNTSAYLQVSPLDALGCRGAPELSHCNRVNRLPSQRMQGGCCGSGYVIPERKKVQRDPSYFSVFGF